jgi:membrane protease YdiL (CAAX protease family)
VFGTPPPPGWYPDPAGAERAERRWDGQQWSGDVRLPAAAVGRPGGGAGAALGPAGPPGQSGAPAAASAGVGSAAPGTVGAGPARIPVRAVWWALLGLLVGELVGSIVAGLVSMGTGSVTGAVPTLFGELGLWAGMLGSCLYVSRRYGSGSLVRDFALRIRPVDLLFGTGAGLVGLVVSDVVGAGFAGSRFAGSNTQILTGQKGNGAGFVIVTLIVALGAPMFEELFFRGLIRTALASRLGPTGAVWAQAGLFGLAHYEPGSGLGNISVMVAIGCFGVVLGYTAKLTGRLGGGMVAHSLFNTLAAIAILVS